MKDKRIYIRISEEDLIELDMQCVYTGLNRSELVRTMIYGNVRTNTSVRTENKEVVRTKKEKIVDTKPPVPPAKKYDNGIQTDQWGNKYRILSNGKKFQMPQVGRGSR